MYSVKYIVSTSDNTEVLKQFEKGTLSYDGNAVVFFNTEGDPILIVPLDKLVYALLED